MKKNHISRRNFIKKSGLGFAVFCLPQLSPGCSNAAEQPNILWIVSEDNSPFLGCYGDKTATTPNLDKLASQGILYENAFANAPVCAPARSTIISGMYPPCMGTQHMRSKNVIPDFIKFFPQLLRDAGYYCSNNRKEDYNMPKPAGVWDESSNKADYINRRPQQPFFAIFNYTNSHESSIHTKAKITKHDPEKVFLPPYLPDTPEIRHDLALYYDKVQEMDARVGTAVKKLEEAGLAEDTIVFYYSDHGGVLPRSKRFIYDSGTQVPFIVRFPDKYKHLAPAKPGSRLDRLISFVDLAPTILSLTGVQIPKYMQGEAFLGKAQQKPREYVYFFRGRMDERYDMMRGVRDKQFRYIRNYMPHRIYGQHLNYLWLKKSMTSWEETFKNGMCNTTQSIFWNKKPTEELYDCKADPHEVNNLAPDPEYRVVLEKMRKVNKKWIREMADSGFIPEGEMLNRIKNQTAYDLIHDKKFPVENIIHAAELAGEQNPDNLPELTTMLNDKESVIRYWGGTGCAILGTKAKPTARILEKTLNDSSADVRIACAEALCNLGKADIALPILIEAAQSNNSKVALHALNVLDIIGDKAKPARAVLADLAKNSNDNYVKRAAGYTLGKW